MSAARAALALLLAAVAGCRNPGPDEGSPAPLQALPGPAPTVVGTVVDARTGKPVAGASVRGPGGVEATSDARGRFVLRGLASGATGELVATAPGGRRGTNRLRPLAGGALEVVVHVR